MRVDWKKFEGQVVNNMFPLRRYLASTSYSGVFLTQSAHEQPKNLAIKFISAGAKADSQLSLLLRASKLDHPTVLRLLPGGRHKLGDMDLVFVVMEYAEEDLGRTLPNRPLAANEAREMLGPLLGALRYIHGKGFAHGHIKPSNIMAIGNQLKLSSDAVVPFGEARPAHRPVDAYEAPEAGKALVAGTSDVWSLGMTLVEILTQHIPVLPPEGQDDPIVPSTVPQPFFEIAQQCLRRDPLQRWTTVQIADCLNPAPIRTATTAAANAGADKAAAAVAMAKVSSDAGKTAPTPAIAPQATAEKPMKPATSAELWQDIHYSWVVLCKNYFFHMRQNLFFRHRIPLAYTDPFSPIPDVEGPFKVRCDDCGKTYVYKRSDLRRYEGEVPKFTTHPLF
jgi:hypothetical protein